MSEKIKINFWESFRRDYTKNKEKMKMSEKIKRTDIEACPNWDLLIGCWNCNYFDNEKGKKSNCPFHKDQTFESQKKALLILDKVHLNSEFGKVHRALKGENGKHFLQNADGKILEISDTKEITEFTKRYLQKRKRISQEFKDNQFLEWSVLEHAVLTEGENQVRKWGIQRHTLSEWLMYTTEELGELSKAISEYVYREGTVSEIYREAIQTATLALKIAEMIFTGG